MADPISVSFDALALNLARRLVGDGDVANAVQSTMSGVLSDLFSLVQQVCSKGDWLGTAFGAASTTSDVGNALQIAEVLAGLTPPDLLQQMTRALGGVVPPVQQSSAAQPSTKTPVKDPIPDLMQALKKLKDPSAPTAMAALAAVVGINRSLLKLAVGATPSGWSGKWDPATVVRKIQDSLRNALKQLSDAAMPGARSKAVAAEIQAELTGPFLRRCFVGSGLSGVGFLMYGLNDLEDVLQPRSSGTLGTEVHQRLQEEYRRNRIRNVIVQESMVYFNNWATPLAKAQASDVNLFALSIARASVLWDTQQIVAHALTDEISFSLRDDNLDLTLGTEWEIKPILGTAVGVVQEMAYRTFYNFVAAFLADMPMLVPPTIGKAPQGWVTRDHVFAGTKLHWPEILSNPVRLVGGFGRVPRKSISLVTVDSLPGLLLYLTYDFNPVTTFVIAKALEKLLNSIAKRIDKAFPILVEGLVAAFMFLAATVVAVGLIVALVSGAAEIAAAVEAAMAVLGPILAAIGTRGGEIVDLLKKIVQQVVPVATNYDLNVTGVDSSGTGAITLRFSLKPGTSPMVVPCSDAICGPFRLENVPMQLLAAMPGILSLGSVISSAVIQQRLQPKTESQPTPAQPNA
jgi:Ca2+/Na+ antiporter